MCVGNDGTCGVAGPSSSSTGQLAGGVLALSTSSGATIARIAGIKGGHVYSRRRAPRVLKGEVQVRSGGTLREVLIRLQRRHGGRCFDFSGSREAFVRAKRCRAAAFFSVGSSESFSYLLPAPLPPGTYSYDIEAVEATGKHTSLVNGVSHVVFRVA